jgi:hypothetical protein
VLRHCALGSDLVALPLFEHRAHASLRLDVVLVDPIPTGGRARQSSPAAEGHRTRATGEEQALDTATAA